MQIEFEASPSYAMAIVHLDRGESVVAESGAMAAMTGELAVDAKLSGQGDGGLVQWLQALVFALARRFLAGESVFVNHFRARSDGQQVMIAPAMVGDIVHVQLDGQRSLVVQSGSYLASTPGVVVDLIWGGFSMLFGGEGAFFLKCTGTGDLLVNSYGGIEEVAVDGTYRVDTGHVVAWEGNLSYKILRAGGWKSTLLSGEGLVLEFSGTGTVWLQTRGVSSLVSWITPFFGRR